MSLDWMSLDWMGAVLYSKLITTAQSVQELLHYEVSGTYLYTILTSTPFSPQPGCPVVEHSTPLRR